MRYMDCVEVVVEKSQYASHGVHKGMQGWICDERNIENGWLVNFPQYGEKDDITTISGSRSRPAPAPRWNECCCE